MSDQEVSVFCDTQQEKLLGFVLRMGLAPDDAEEVSNSCFLAISSYWHAIRYGNPRVQLYRMALAEIYGHIRDDNGDAADRGTRGQALLSLTEREREAVLLRYYVQCDIAETAMIMDDIKQSNAERYAAAGRTKLARKFGGDDPQASPADGSL